MIRSRWLLVALLGVLGMVGAAQTPRSRGKDPEIESVAKYRSWHLVTPKPVDMTPQIMLSCIGPGTADQDPSPHIRAVFRVYVNSKGQKAMKGLGKSTFPVGSILLKEKFLRPADDFKPVKLAPDAKPELMTVMIKRAKGFDPANGDWQFAVIKPGYAPETENLQHCQSCHQKVKKSDFVFGDYDSIRHG